MRNLYTNFIFSFALSCVAQTAIAQAVYPAPTAPTVYPGCAVAPATPTGNVWYVDPINGSNSGNGSAAQPWHTLAEVVAAGLFSTSPTNGPVRVAKKAPISPGDTVYLLTGNHGTVAMQGQFGSTSPLTGYNNPTFITIAAYPGQTPVLNRLTINGASHWAFRGLTIQSLNTNGYYQSSSSNNKDFFLVTINGLHDNIIFDSNTLLSTPNVMQWAITDWITNRASGIQETGGTCITFTNNNIYNIGFGIATQLSDYVLIAGNSVNYFADDGIDYGSNDTTIINNIITNCIEDGDGVHRDGIQGQPYSESTNLNNVTIANNTIIRITDPNIPLPGYLQGIDNFDGTSSQLYVTNNTMVVDSTDGLVFYGITNASISGNILMQDSGEVLPCSHLTFTACLSLSVIYDQSNLPGLIVGVGKQGTASSNVTITNNIVNTLAFDLTTSNLTVANNLCIRSSDKCTLGLPINGVMKWYTNPGTYGGHNVIPNFGPATLFAQFNTATPAYNFALQIPNPAITN